MIREMGKSEGEESLRPKKLKNSEKPKGHGINSTNQRALGGHVACGAATTHLIRSESPRSWTAQENFSSSMVFVTRHGNHRSWGQLMGLTSSHLLDKTTKKDEVVLTN